MISNLIMQISNIPILNELWGVVLYLWEGLKILWEIMRDYPGMCVSVVVITLIIIAGLFPGEEAIKKACKNDGHFWYGGWW